jgi:hypothetical protein
MTLRLEISVPRVTPGPAAPVPQGIRHFLRHRRRTSAQPWVTGRLPGGRGAGCAQGPVAVGVELGELAGDINGVGAVEVDVLVVGGPDVGQHGVIDVPPGTPERGDGQAVVLGRPGDHCVGG